MAERRPQCRRHPYDQQKRKWSTVHTDLQCYMPLPAITRPVKFSKPSTELSTSNPASPRELLYAGVALATVKCDSSRAVNMEMELMQC